MGCKDAVRKVNHDPVKDSVNGTKTPRFAGRPIEIGLVNERGTGEGELLFHLLERHA